MARDRNKRSFAEEGQDGSGAAEARECEMERKCDADSNNAFGRKSEEVDLGQGDANSETDVDAHEDLEDGEEKHGRESDGRSVNARDGIRTRAEQEVASVEDSKAAGNMQRVHPENVKYVDYLNKMKRRVKTIQGISMIKRATASIKQYPLPIIHPGQFQILEGIGNYLGSQLEKLIENGARSGVDSDEQEERGARLREYRMLKIEELNKLVDPILERFPEADNSLLEALEDDSDCKPRESEVIGQIDELNENKKGLLNKATAKERYMPQIYGDRWCVLVVLGLLEKLRNSVSHFTKATIQDLYMYLKSTYLERMLIKNLDKSVKELIKMEYVREVNGGASIKGFPIKTQNLRYCLTDKGKKVSFECCNSVSLLKYILEADEFNHEHEGGCHLSVKDKIRALSDRMTHKVLANYEIVMIIDYREVNTADAGHFGEGDGGVKKAKLNTSSNPKSSGISQNLLNRLRDQGFKIELKNLPIGDIIWVARPVYENNNEQIPIEESYVLPWIIERKTGSDMCSSIMDGRYEEQKYRLMRSLGVENVIYLLEDLNSIHENIIWSSGSNGPISSGRVAPKQILRTAQTSTQFISGFHILQSQSTGHTLALLVGLHQAITGNIRSRYGLFSSKDNLDTSLDQNVAIIESISKRRPKYKDWEIHSKKSSNMSVEEVFGRQLRSIKGCGPEATETLLSIWPTPYLMYKDMSNNSFEDVYKKVLDRWEVIQSKRFGNQNPNNIFDGQHRKKRSKPSVSKDLLRQLYHLYGGDLFRDSHKNGESSAKEDIFELKF